MKFAKTPALHNLCTLSSTSLVFAEEHEKRVEVVKVQKIASYQPRIFRIFVFFGTHTEANNNQNCLIFNLKVKQMWAQFGINCHMYEPKLAKWDFLSEFQTLWCNRVFKGSTSRIALKARKSNYVVEQGEGSWIIFRGRTANFWRLMDARRAREESFLPICSSNFMLMPQLPKRPSSKLTKGF